MFKDFKKFILRGNVVDLAVAVVVGAAFGAVVTAIVADFIQPLITGVLGGKGEVQGIAHLDIWHWHFVFPWGDLLTKIIAFLAVAATVFFFVVQPLNKLMTHLKPSDEVDSPAERKCPECLSGIPAEAKRCKFCGVASKPTKKAA
jgi:large conductance mechanosensitive channel